MNEKSCDQCKHWMRTRANHELRITNGLLVAVCGKAEQWWEVSHWVKSDHPNWHQMRSPKPEFTDLMMFTQDASDYESVLLTRADFYCAHFEKGRSND